MNVKAFSLNGLFALSLLVTVSFSQQALAGSPAEVKLVSQSDTVKIVEAQVAIDAPPEVVWKAVTNYANMKNVLPGYVKSNVISDNGSSATVDIATKASGLVPAFSYQVKINENKAANSVSIQRISGDFNAIQASYKLVPMNQGARTLLVYNLKIDVGNEVPKLGLNHVVKGNAKAGVEALQAHCNKTYQRSLTASAAK